MDMKAELGTNRIEKKLQCWRRLLRILLTARNTNKMDHRTNQVRTLTQSTNDQAGHSTCRSSSLNKNIMLENLKEKAHPALKCTIDYNRNDCDAEIFKR